MQSNMQSILSTMITKQCEMEQRLKSLKQDNCGAARNGAQAHNLWMNSENQETRYGLLDIADKMNEFKNVSENEIRALEQQLARHQKAVQSIQEIVDKQEQKDMMEYMWAMFLI